MRIILFIAIFYCVREWFRKFKMAVEKLEEYNGEFIYTFFDKVWKKEIYFNLKEIEEILFTKIIISQNSFMSIGLRIYLKDGYQISLNKKESCIKLLKSCKYNENELYEKVFKRVPMGIDIYNIVENEIEKF